MSKKRPKKCKEFRFSAKMKEKLEELLKLTKLQLILRLLDMEGRLFKICGEKKIEIIKVPVPEYVPCCFKIKRGIFYNENTPSGYADSFYQNTGLNAFGMMQQYPLTDEKIKTILFKNTTPYFIQFLCLGTDDEGNFIELPEVFNLAMGPNEDGVKNFDDVQPLTDPSGALGWSVNFFADAAHTQPVEYDGNGIVEAIFLAVTGCGDEPGDGGGYFPGSDGGLYYYGGGGGIGDGDLEDLARPLRFQQILNDSPGAGTYTVYYGGIMSIAPNNSPALLFTEQELGITTPNGGANIEVTITDESEAVIYTENIYLPMNNELGGLFPAIQLNIPPEDLTTAFNVSLIFDLGGGVVYNAIWQREIDENYGIWDDGENLVMYENATGHIVEAQQHISNIQLKNKGGYILVDVQFQNGIANYDVIEPMDVGDGNPWLPSGINSRGTIWIDFENEPRLQGILSFVGFYSFGDGSGSLARFILTNEDADASDSFQQKYTRLKSGVVMEDACVKLWNAVLKDSNGDEVVTTKYIGQLKEALWVDPFLRPIIFNPESEGELGNIANGLTVNIPEGCTILLPENTNDPLIRFSAPVHVEMTAGNSCTVIFFAKYFNEYISARQFSFSAPEGIDIQNITSLAEGTFFDGGDVNMIKEVRVVFLNSNNNPASIEVMFNRHYENQFTRTDIQYSPYPEYTPMEDTEEIVSITYKSGQGYLYATAKLAAGKSISYNNIGGIEGPGDVQGYLAGSSENDEMWGSATLLNSIDPGDGIEVSYIMTNQNTTNDDTYDDRYLRGDEDYPWTAGVLQYEDVNIHQGKVLILEDVVIGNFDFTIIEEPTTPVIYKSNAQTVGSEGVGGVITIEQDTTISIVPNANVTKIIFSPPVHVNNFGAGGMQFYIRPLREDYADLDGFYFTISEEDIASGPYITEMTSGDGGSINQMAEAGSVFRINAMNLNFGNNIEFDMLRPYKQFVQVGGGFTEMPNDLSLPPQETTAITSVTFWQYEDGMMQARLKFAPDLIQLNIAPISGIGQQLGVMKVRVFDGESTTSFEEALVVTLTYSYQENDGTNVFLCVVTTPNASSTDLFPAKYPRYAEALTGMQFLIPQVDFAQVGGDPKPNYLLGMMDYSDAPEPEE